MENTDRDFLKKMIDEEHSKPQMLRILNWIGSDKNRVAALVEVFLVGENPTTQRAAWPLGDLGTSQPELFAPHLPALLAFVKKPENHVAVSRNVLRILENIELPDEYLGEIADLVFSIVADPNAPIANRAFSMTVAWRICQKEPELANELRLIIEENWAHSTPAFKSRGRKILASIRLLENDKKG